MVYTVKIKQAIKFAIKTHELYQKQKRKGKDIAYITHPLTVGIILSQAHASEEVVIAGILHDTIEDSLPEKKVNLKMITERFGDKVADLVWSVTEKDKKLSWKKRKTEALRDISSFSHESLLLKSGDIISNVSEIIDDYQRYGDLVFARFYASKELTLNHYLKVIIALQANWKQSPLNDDLQYWAQEIIKIIN